MLYYMRDSLAVLRRGINCIAEEALAIGRSDEVDLEACPLMLEQHAFSLIIRKIADIDDPEPGTTPAFLDMIHVTNLALFDGEGNPRYSLSMLYIGPHVSIASSVALAPERASALGATGFAIFTKNQRVWSAAALEDESIAAFRTAMERHGYSPDAVLPHAGYLINPATPDEDLRRKSEALFSDEAGRVITLGLSTINIHPGAYKEGERRDGLERSAAMMDRILDAYPTLRIAVENTAGAGTVLGSTFEELDQLISLSRNKDRLGITLDTAHLFGAGYDVKEDITGVMESFLSRFGRDKLYGMHLNDSKVPLSSHKDRHESLGLGLIGMEAFMEIVRMDAADGIPLVLETPDDSRWKDEIATLLSVSRGT